MIREAIYSFPQAWCVGVYIFHRVMQCECGHVHKPGQTTHSFQGSGYARFPICNGCNDVPLNWRMPR